MICMARDTSWQSAKTGTSGTTETNGTSFCEGDCPHDVTGSVPARCFVRGTVPTRVAGSVPTRFWSILHPQSEPRWKEFHKTRNAPNPLFNQA